MPETALLSLHHVGLSVTNLERSIGFYSNIVGFQVLARFSEPSHYAFLGANGSVFVTLWEEANASYTVNRAGLHHLAFGVPEHRDLIAMEERLRSAGVSIRYDGIVAHREGSASAGLFLEDPDGIRIEVTAPAPADQDIPAPSGSVTACGFF